jgi:hypothetical protein
MLGQVYYSELPITRLTANSSQKQVYPSNSSLISISSEQVRFPIEYFIVTLSNLSFAIPPTQFAEINLKPTSLMASRYISPLPFLDNPQPHK